MRKLGDRKKNLKYIYDCKNIKAQYIFVWSTFLSNVTVYTY